MLSEADLELVEALQIAPRASWVQLGEVLDRSPASLARRWQRLESTGRAWTALVPSARALEEMALTHVQVRCRPGQVQRVARDLAEDQQVLTVHSITGDYDVLLLLRTDGAASLERYLGERIGSLPGVVRQRALPVLRPVRHGSTWRLGTLDPQQRRRLREAAPPPPAPGARPAPFDERVVAALTVDGRVTATELQERLRDEGDGARSSLSTVRRDLARVLRSPAVTVRCEVSAPEAGWPMAGVLWCRLPAARLSELAAGAWDDGTEFGAGLPEARSCTVVAGSVNLHLTVWLRGMSHLQAIEHRLAALEPALEVVDRSVVLSSLKRMGALLEDGRRVRAVPTALLGGGSW
ncbi:Lrp/AsnC ligand binding domain-containing protein [Kineococcus sp. SYSU DK002]|uniref:Lrp/AsnC ligand binding domain-containing protein n=1 Tax=Kineococcus sp. SYSU DK002 TaxID=3383123 RepID=UPI003D7CE742